MADLVPDGATASAPLDTPGRVSAAAPGPVFIVDDDRAVGRALKFALTVEGWPAQVFDGAERFLARHHRPDRGCLIVDLYMPGLTGLDLTRILRRRGCDLLIALITGRPDADLRRRAARAGVDCVLEKPLTGPGLVEAVLAAAAGIPPILSQPR